MAADAIIIGTPILQASISAALKNVFDTNNSLVQIRNLGYCFNGIFVLQQL